MATNEHELRARTDTNKDSEGKELDKGSSIVEKDLSYRIVGAALKVHKIMKEGFNEKVYENSLMKEFEKQGIRAQQQAQLTVYYEGENVGRYYADILVEDTVILEIKCAKMIAPEHSAQAINYLRASGLKLALILNFGNPRFDYKRVVL